MRTWREVVLAVVVAGCNGTIFDPGSSGGTVPGSLAPEIGRELDCDAAGGVHDPGPSTVRRLTAAQYVATVRDALGVDVSDVTTGLPVETPSEGFLNDANNQIVDADHITVYASAAQEVVRRIGELDAFIGSYTSCVEPTAACETEFVDTLGLRLFRRPPDAEDRRMFVGLFDALVGQGETFVQAAEGVLVAMLQSPPFLYRIERQIAPGATTRRLDDHELASRLSYLVWDGPPDDTLFGAAAAGELSSDAGLIAQLDRMLASERARGASLAFLRGWLDLAQLTQLATELRDDMRAETEAVFIEVVWEREEPLQALYTTPYTFVSPALATHYGMEPVGTDVARYELPPDGARRGILTHASLLSRGHGSIVQRGLFVLRNVLCSDVGRPPIGVADTAPTTGPGTSARDLAEERMVTQPCAGCHTQFDPLAFPLEVFDDLGAPRETDEHGNALRTNGVWVTPYDREGVPFADTSAFVDLVGSDERASDCLIMKQVRFAVGRALDRADACTLAAIREAAPPGRLTYQGVLRTLVTTSAFREIRAE